MDTRLWKRGFRYLVLVPLRKRVAPFATLEVSGSRFRVDLRDVTIAQRLYLGHEFEPELQRFLCELDLSGACALDIGANIGLHTVMLGKLVGTSGQVFAFEPEEHNSELLRRNLRLNALDNVVLSRSVVSDRAGTCSIGLNPINFGDHRVSDLAPEGWQTQKAQMVTIDGSFQHLPANIIRLIKIDVQGHEISVLRGMKRTLDRNPDAVIVIEVQPDLLARSGRSGSQLIEMLLTWQFEGWELHESRVLPLAEPWVYDLLFEETHVNVVLSRNTKLLRKAMSTYSGMELPTPPQ